MALSLKQVRAAVAQQVDALAGFHQSKFPIDYFGRTANQTAHLAFACSIESSTALNERQRITVGIMLQSACKVVFSFRIRPHDLITDYDNALDKEVEVIKACTSSYASILAGMQIRYERSNRRLTESNEYIIIEMEFTITHTI